MNRFVNVLIVEDEVVIAQDIKGALEEIGYGVIGISRDYERALKVLDYESPDLVLLDITLKGNKSGIDLANYITTYLKIPFIFITSHADNLTIDKAKKTKPNGYLVKPFNQEDLFAAIEIALYNYNESQPTIKILEKGNDKVFKDSIFIKTNGVFQRLRLNEISHFEADGIYTNVYVENSKYTDRKVLLDYDKTLPDTQFMRIHRSFIVNVDHITGIKQNEVILGHIKVPLGRTFRDKIMSSLR